MKWALAALFAAVGYCGALAAEPAPPSIAVFDFELVDTSLEGASYGVDPAETKRLALLGGVLRDLLTQSGRYRVVDTAPVAPQIANAGYIHGCNGCEVIIAKKLGADRVMTGIVQKVSTLILALAIYERDVATGQMVKVASAQIRGNTDESWTHGLKWLVRNRLLPAK